MSEQPSNSTTPLAPNESDVSSSVLRYIAIWLMLCLGTAVAVGMIEGGRRLCSPLVPLSMTMLCSSYIGLATFCLWGLPFTIPMLFLAKAWLHHGSGWKLLPPIFYLQGIVSSISLAFMADNLPNQKELQKLSDEAIQEKLGNLAAAAAAKWPLGLKIAAIFLALILLHILLCGYKDSWKAIRETWQSIRESCRTMKDSSQASSKKPDQN